MSGGGRLSEPPTLSVWPVAQTAARFQRQGRYLPESTAHPAKMLPELARRAIAAYSDPGDLVVDPMCGVGTTLVEAIHLGRRAIGVEFEPRWAALAAANVLHARAQGAQGHALALRGDARQLCSGLLDELAGTVPLILTSPPYSSSTHGQVRLHADGVENFDERYSRNALNLAHLPPRRSLRARPTFASALAEILAGCRRLLRPGGRLVVTARPYRSDGALVDLPGELIALARSAGLQLEARYAALLCGLRGDRLVQRASFFQMQKLRSGAFPRMLLIAHEDVLAFVAAGIPASSPRATRSQRQTTASARPPAHLRARLGEVEALEDARPVERAARLLDGRGAQPDRESARRAPRRPLRIIDPLLALWLRNLGGWRTGARKSPRTSVRVSEEPRGLELEI